MRCESICYRLAVAAILLLGGCASTRSGEDGARAIDAALAGPNRSEANRARDVFRHPKETLQFFGLEPGMTVVEIWPGGGWYTEILAPVVRGKGVLYAAHFHIDGKGPKYREASRSAFFRKLGENPAVYDQVRVTTFGAPEYVAIAPAGSVDLVLTFRNVHNWAAAKSEEAGFRAFYAALKPGGILGVVEHRAREGASLEEMIKSGYMSESYVIALAQKAGFRLLGRSEVNANAKDTKDYPRGVWTLPPTYRMGDQDRAKYAAIGESDRMTLKFVKPASP